MFSFPTRDKKEWRYLREWQFNPGSLDVNLSSFPWIVPALKDRYCLQQKQQQQQQQKMQPIRWRLPSEMFSDAQMQELCEALALSSNSINSNCNGLCLTEIVGSKSISVNSVLCICQLLSQADNCITELHVYSCELSSTSVMYIAQALSSKHCSLTEMTLRGNKIGDEGVKHIAEALEKHNKSLLRLTFFDMETTAISAGYMGKALKSNASLIYLDMSLDDESASALIEQGLLHNRTLTS